MTPENKELIEEEYIMRSCYSPGWFGDVLAEELAFHWYDDDLPDGYPDRYWVRLYRVGTFFMVQRGKGYSDVFMPEFYLDLQTAIDHFLTSVPKTRHIWRDR